MRPEQAFESIAAKRAYEPIPIIRYMPASNRYALFLQDAKCKPSDACQDKDGEANCNQELTSPTNAGPPSA